jgi:inorganic pyrophosphatase
LTPSHSLTRRYDHVHEYSDLPDITTQQIEHFFEHYKDLEPGKWVKIGDWHGADDAKQLISDAIERANT